MPEDRPFLPIGNPNEPFNIAEVCDDISATISDPYEQAVAKQVAMNLLVDYTPDSRQEAFDRLANSSNQARRAYWDRAAQQIGEPTLTEKAVETSLRNPSPTNTPTRDGQGRTIAFCGGCGHSEPGDGTSQFKWVDCYRYWCEICLQDDPDGSRHADMEPYQPPAYELSPTGFIDVRAQERETRQIEAEMSRRKAVRDAVQEERAADAEVLRSHEEAKAERDRKENALQNPWAA